MQLNLKNIFGKFKPGFVAQRKWWNGRNPPYEKYKGLDGSSALKYFQNDMW